VNTGDDLRQVLRAGAGSRARVTTQGAVSVHRARAGRGSSETTRLQVAAGGWLEYLPEPRVLFPGADLAQRLDIEADPAGVALVVESFVLNAVGDEECRYRSVTRVLRAGDVVAQEHVQHTFPGHPTSSVGAGAYAVVLLVASDCDVMRASEGWQCWHQRSGCAERYGAVSSLPGRAGLVVRVAAANGLLLRQAVSESLPLLRASMAGSTGAA
jgi:urease accessory protein